MLTLYIADVERDVGMKKLSQEEAAKVLEDMKVKMEIPKAAVTQWKKNTALDMAIEALKHSEVPNSSDCISRQAAIDVLKGLPTWWADEGGHYGGAQPPMVALLDPEDAVSAIENLPSAQPEREKGKWTKDCACEICGFKPWYERDIHTLSFCPNCGAKMSGGEQE